MIEENPSGEETAIAEILELPEKCTRQSVLIAVLRPKFRSSQQKDGRFTVGNVFLNTGRPEKPADTKLNYINEFTSTVIFFFTFWAELQLCFMNFSLRARCSLKIARSLPNGFLEISGFKENSAYFPFSSRYFR